jgi:hypothetical protein
MVLAAACCAMPMPPPGSAVPVTARRAGVSCGDIGDRTVAVERWRRRSGLGWRTDDAGERERERVSARVACEVAMERCSDGKMEGATSRGGWWWYTRVDETFSGACHKKAKQNVGAICVGK